MWSFSKAQLCGLYPYSGPLAGSKAHNKAIIALTKTQGLVHVWDSCGAAMGIYIIPALTRDQRGRQTNTEVPQEKEQTYILKLTIDQINLKQAQYITFYM